MKFKNIKFSAIAYYSDGTESKARMFATEEAMSNWANKQYNKDNGCAISVWNGLFETPYCTYHG